MQGKDLLVEYARQLSWAVGAETERRIRRGCTGCCMPMIEMKGDELRPIPGGTIIYHQHQVGPGSPYCGQCLYAMGIACLPGDDYVI